MNFYHYEGILTMLLDQNPLTLKLHEYQRHEIIQAFPQINTQKQIPLIFWNYLNGRPEKFYSDEIFHIALSTLNQFLKKYPDQMANFLIKENNEFNIALRQLIDINSLPIHDDILPKDDLDLIKFCDNTILPSYLKLVEGVFHVIINPIIAFIQLENGKPIKDLPLFDQIEKLKYQYAIFTESVSRTMRNGIAHGGVIFRNNDITFIDKKGKKETYRIQDVIPIFDNLLDACNAIVLAFLLLYHENHDFFKNNNISLPITIIYEELKSELKSPGWEIKGCLESQTFNGRSQLNIFTSNSFRDKSRLVYHVIRTMHITNIYAPSYDRYFLKINSKHYLNGFISFNGIKIRELQSELSDDNVSKYFSAIESPLIWHRDLPFSKFYTYAATLLSAIKVAFPLEFQKIKKKNFNYFIEPRFIEVSTERYINRARVSIIIHTHPNIKIDDLIRKNIEKILKKSIRFARKDISYFSLSKYLPISFIHINVLTKDFRKRKMGYPGLISELICTIERDKTKKVKLRDIATGIPEVIRDIRLVWNKRSGYPKDL